MLSYSREANSKKRGLRGVRRGECTSVHEFCKEAGKGLCSFCDQVKKRPESGFDKLAS